MNVPEIGSLRQIRKSIKYQGRFPDCPDLKDNPDRRLPKAATEIGL